MLPGYDEELSPKELKEYRQRLRKMTDPQLIRERNACTYLCSPEANWGRPPRRVFVAHLKEARTEWRRRHPKTESRVSARGVEGRR